ncbi:hypothetical protein FE391_18675 [Nonomuraea sp. KC401]|uniref:hypothetical protein n=1 Tax=unclassified Nonomuraea TaxID=2593643 RepID=UPI0010FE40A1|nr:MULTISPECIES: hypothetical protein [unclassified Nonomuraea]NBE95090.1 hypothetical protein [Nonomuraea sp. K271]TLF71703.1 hypothetical protein FE391_18675 [Nonomuraea sp. KC401]
MTPSDGPAWTDIFTAIAAVVALVVSLFSVWFARRQASAAIDQSAGAQRAADAAKDQAVSARDQAEIAAKQLALDRTAFTESQQPYVVVDIRASDFISEALILIVENVGPTVARNVRIRFNPPIQTSMDGDDGEKLADALIFTQGVPHVPPGRRIEALFDIGWQFFKKDLPRKYTVTVEADGPYGAVEPLTYLIDLEIYRKLRHLTIKTRHQQVKEIEKLRKAVEKASQELARPRREAEAAEWRQVVEEQREQTRRVTPTSAHGSLQSGTEEEGEGDVE